MKDLLYRPVIVTGMLLGILLLVELATLSGLTLRNLQRIDTIEHYLDHGERLQKVASMLENIVLDTSKGRTESSRHLADLKQRIGKLREYEMFSGTTAMDELQLLEKLTLKSGVADPNELAKALAIIDRLHDGQTRAESILLDKVYADTKLELNFALGAPLLVLGVILLSGRYILRHHILDPLDSLNELISRLTEGEFSPIEATRGDRLLMPLFDNYNRLVRRLAELEEKHRSHALSLEREVRSATRTLLEQSRNLARAERLAAVGELAASTAHELRNPLAGVQVALENMRLECTDSEFAERFGLITGELARVNQRLTDLLATSRHTPEAARQCDLSALVDDLLTLLRYQIDEHIELCSEVKPGLLLYLPENDMRQVLLNLTLNATQALNAKNGRITVSATTENNKLVIKVCDNGPGFPAEFLVGGARPFATYREDGTGLGLLMVQRFAENLGGKLILTNQCRETCAALVLPLHDNHA